MDKIKFTAPETGEDIEVYVLEQTTLQGKNYLLVTEDEEDSEEAECYILKEIAVEGDDVDYEFVEDDNELEAVAKVFSELLDDTDIEF